MWRNATKKGKSNLKKKSMYRMVFDTEFNLAFHMPKRCLQILWVVSTIRRWGTTKHENCLPKSIQKTLARSLFYKAAAFDLEQVLNTPWRHVSSLYFSCKLSTWNLKVYELDTKDTEFYMWYEGESRHGSSEMSNCVFKYLSAILDVNHVGLYSDTVVDRTGT